MSETQKFTTDDTLPTIYIPYPQCGHCGKDVIIEDGHVRCEDCLVWWDHISEDLTAQPDDNLDGTEVPCGVVTDKVREPYDYIGKHWVFSQPKPCILPSGHESDHLCPYTTTVTELVSGNEEVSC